MLAKGPRLVHRFPAFAEAELRDGAVALVGVAEAEVQGGQDERTGAAEQFRGQVLPVVLQPTGHLQHGLRRVRAGLAHHAGQDRIAGEQAGQPGPGAQGRGEGLEPGPGRGTGQQPGTAGPVQVAHQGAARVPGQASGQAALERGADHGVLGGRQGEARFDLAPGGVDQRPQNRAEDLGAVGGLRRSAPGVRHRLIRGGSEGCLDRDGPVRLGDAGGEALGLVDLTGHLAGRPERHKPRGKPVGVPGGARRGPQRVETDAGLPLGTRGLDRGEPLAQCQPPGPPPRGQAGGGIVEDSGPFSHRRKISERRPPHMGGAPLYSFPAAARVPRTPRVPAGRAWAHPQGLSQV